MISKVSKEQQVVVELGVVGTGKNSYIKKKINLVNPPARNVMVDTQKEFTRSEVKIAKADWRTAQLENQL